MTKSISVVHVFSRQATAWIAALALAATAFSMPSQARADGKALVKGAAAVMIICALGGCGGAKASKKKRSGGSKSSSSRTAPKGPSDAIAMSKPQKMMIQEGLAARGFYSGAIDGLVGRGTRTSIRNWQTAMGYGVTGVLTGAQINELVAASSSYAMFPASDPRLFEADIAPDLDREALKTLQAKLNALGYDAGPVDGSFGPSTRRAIAAYKADSGLLGEAIPTRRLLAHVEGGDFVDESAPVLAKATASGEQGDMALEAEMASSVDAAMTTPALPTEEVASASVLYFEVAGMRLGMLQDEIAEVAELELEGDFRVASAAADAFDGSGLFTEAQYVVQDSWPQPGSNFVASFHDEALPELGAVAIYRSVILPDGLTVEQVEKAILPDLIEAYGREGLVEDTMTFVGSDTARTAARRSIAVLDTCGAPAISVLDTATPADATDWTTYNGLKVDPASLDTATESCGNVLKISFDEKRLDFMLWDSDLMAEHGGTATDAVAIPKIKF